MLGAGLGIRVATVQAAGQFDSHENQLGSHGDDLADVGDCDLYAGIIDGHLGGDVERCLPGYRGTPVAIVG